MSSSADTAFTEAVDTVLSEWGEPFSAASTELTDALQELYHAELQFPPIWPEHRRRAFIAHHADIDAAELSTQFDDLIDTVTNEFGLAYGILPHPDDAAELITTRANPTDPHFGLLAWKGDKVRKADIVVAKNYLTEDEIDTLNRLVVIFLETAELRAKGKLETRMAFWKGNVDQIITSNGFPLLTHTGTISHEQMEARTDALYRQFDQDRKRQEAIEADRQDDAELNALQAKLKRRPKQ